MSVVAAVVYDEDGSELARGNDGGCGEGVADDDGMM